MTFSTYVFEIVGDPRWGHRTMFGTRSRHDAIVRFGLVPSAMELLDIWKILMSIIILIIILFILLYFIPYYPVYTVR